MANLSSTPTLDPSQIVQAQILVPCDDIRTEMPYFQSTLGFRLDKIFPSDDPAVAIISGHGLRLRLERNADAAPITLRLACSDPSAFAQGHTLFTTPSGNTIIPFQHNPPLFQPETQHNVAIRRLADEAPWVIGRAGMLYRDLLPDRLGGAIIASHIRIPDGGPVPDMVHYHTIGFQLIYCYRGWVRLVYEDQGPEFILRAGDCVIQPPEIRHRVLEASDNVEVVEIGVPADHETTIDHDMTLPNGPANPDRRFQGQRFVRHQVKDATWAPWRIDGFEFRETGICDGTQGVASVQVARANGGTPKPTRHDSDILFTFILEGSMTLTGEGHDPRQLQAGDAFVIPPAFTTTFSDCSTDLELLEISLPGVFNTHSP